MMTPSDLAEKIVERAAIGASTVIIDFVSGAIEAALVRFVGRSDEADAKIKDLVEKIKTSIEAEVTDKLKELIDFGRDRGDDKAAPRPSDNQAPKEAEEITGQLAEVIEKLRSF